MLSAFTQEVAYYTHCALPSCFPVTPCILEIFPWQFIGLFVILIFLNTSFYFDTGCLKVIAAEFLCAFLSFPFVVIVHTLSKAGNSPWDSTAISRRGFLWIFPVTQCILFFWGGIVLWNFIILVCSSSDDHKQVGHRTVPSSQRILLHFTNHTLLTTGTCPLISQSTFYFWKNPTIYYTLLKGKNPTFKFYFLFLQAWILTGCVMMPCWSTRVKTKIKPSQIENSELKNRWVRIICFQ